MDDDKTSAAAVAGPVVRGVRPCAWAHRYSTSGLLHTPRDNKQDAEVDAAIVGGTAEVVALYDQRALDEAVVAERDCRTCRQFRGTQHCHSVLRCVDGSSYQRGGVVQLWESAPITPAPF